MAGLGLKEIRFRDLLRVARQPIFGLGLTFLFIFWAASAAQLSWEFQKSIEAAIERGSSATQLFAKDTVQLFKQADATLLLLRQIFERDPEHFDFNDWKPVVSALNDATIEASIIGPDGYLVARTSGLPKQKLYLGDRKHFQIQVNATRDELYISEPLTLRITGQPGIQISRRLRKPDGSFDGIVSATISPGFAEQFSRALALGPESDISVRRPDRVILTSYGYASGRAPTTNSTRFSEALARASIGYFWGVGRSDGTARLNTYRTLSDFPLIVSIGETEDHILGEYRLHRTLYLSSGALLTLIVISYTGLALRRQWDSTEAHANLSAAMNSMSHGMCMFDGQGRLVAFNPHWLAMYGLRPEQVRPGWTKRQFLESCVQAGSLVQDVDSALNDIKKSVAAGRITQKTRPLSDGRTVQVTVTPKPESGWVEIHEDITERRASEAKIEKLAHYDSLTNLANRYLFKELIDDAVAGMRRHSSGFAVFMLDLDRFKAVNDALGHQAGDLLLREVATRIVSAIGEVDMAARLGGDEFAVIVRSGQGPLQEEPAVLAARLIDVISAPYQIDGHDIVIGCSLGIAMAPEHGVSRDLLLGCADLALYKAKSSGRNCFRLFTDDLKTEADNRNLLENDLREAIWREQLEVFYQPVIDLRSGRVKVAEALARWRHPTKGLIAPSTFIPLAEVTGLIVQLGEWIMVRACHDAMSMPKDVKVAVNLSPVQFSKSKLVDAAAFALVDSQLPPERLEFEITEGVLLKETEQNLEILRQIKNLGVSITMDDFGIGYSSLSYLTSFPFDKVKIDRTFIEKLERAETRAVVTSIVQLSRTLSLRTCAEGIETEAQLAEAKSIGIELGQGYLFGRAVPLSDLVFETFQPARTIEAA
jgi:diguanylate cyclase (GGDEF)-like protein/PAS domain S-box-containing protein